MKKNYPTPHINASPSDFASTVLMPGDPLRAKYIAENFLSDATLVNNVRGISGYTGTYGGVRVSVMASGMGMPSIGIYSYELFNFFGVENIIRVGSAGAISNSVAVRDVVLGLCASTDSNYQNNFHIPGHFSAACSYDLLKASVETADKMGIRYHVGGLLSTDVFYGDESDISDSQKSAHVWGKMGVLAVEMEAAALYMNAARAGKRALAICTVSDHILKGEATSAEERQNSFTDMMKLALDTAVKF